jgi:hypothetical protein
MELDRLNSAWLKVPGPDSKSDPTSFVAAEIHLDLGQQASATRWLHCNIQVVCQTKS